MTTEERLAIAVEALERIHQTCSVANMHVVRGALDKIRPFTVDGPGLYMTREGNTYRVVCIDAPGPQPVCGWPVSNPEVDHNGSPKVDYHHLDGRYLNGRGDTSGFDLVSRA